MMNSFEQGQSIALMTKQQPFKSTPSAYDPTISFNRIVEERPKKRRDSIWAPDISKILKTLNSDDLSPIFKTTFVARPARSGAAMWDMFFNTTRYRSVTTAILTAKNDFTPIGKSQIVTSSRFVDLARPTTRTYLTTMVSGDKLGIAISDPAKSLTYVLLYEVDGECIVQTRLHPDDDCATSLPAINVTMHHALQIDHRDPHSAKVLQMGEWEYDEEKTRPFVEWLIDSVYDIRQARSWKTRLIPQVRGFKRKVLEKRLAEEIALYRHIPYSEFERLCRMAYDTAMKVTPPPLPAAADKNKNKRPDIPLPAVEVVSTEDIIYANFENLNLGQMVGFNRDEMGSDAVVEIHLSDKDLNGRIVEDLSEVLILDPSFGKDALLRYFTIGL